MSHRIGTHQFVSPALTIGPDSGPPTSANTWLVNFAPTPAPTGTKFVILHFTGPSFPASNRLEVDLGYDTDVFFAADGPDFWTRPVNLAGGATVAIRYITNGSPTGHVVLADYGRAEEVESGNAGFPDYHNKTNPDVFLLASPYTEPFNETRGLCGATPDWENLACAGPGDIRTAVARSVGIFVMMETSHADPSVLDMSSCSGTLIGPDLVLCAGHCVSSPDELDARSGSFCFDFQTNCDGTRPVGYNPKFHKIKRVVKRAHTSDGGLDYSLIELKTLPGVPTVPMRPDLPSVNDPVFEVHHPQGIPKKVSARHTGLQAKIADIRPSFGFRYIFTNTDLTGGSSGSALFDMSGQILGIADIAGHCQNGFLSITEVMKDISVTPPPPVPCDVMLVLDRSGSMALDAGTGRTRIVEAHDAASLFVQLIRIGAGDRVGLVSFSTTASSPVDFPLSPVNAGTKDALIGPPPFSAGIVGALAPGGLTSIGEGLATGQSQFPAPGPGVNQRTVLLLTDGLQNTPRMIADVDPSLSGDDLSVIGLGSESNLNGALLNSLAEAHNGLYTRAGDGLKLRKFFALAYGNIFEAGTLTDPDFFLPAAQRQAAPFPFHICSEDSVTVVIGWDREDAPLLLALTTPAGNTVAEGSPGTESSSGKTWTFLRISLPFNGERDGGWQVQVFRPGGGEFPPPGVDVHYFLNVVVRGGPRLTRVKQDSRIYYTGDAITPLVMLKNTDGTVPDNASIRVVVTKPANSVGNILSEAGLGAAINFNGDAIAARQATLLGIEGATGKPAINYVDETHDLFDDGGHGDGGMEPDGIFGNPLTDLLKAEGNYTFHAVATFGLNCVSTRETLWTVHVDTGVDPSQTTVLSLPAGTLPDGREDIHMTIVPKDRYGNKLGPGRLDGFSVTGAAGTTVTGSVQDNGDGSYAVDVSWDPSSSSSPGVILTQPGRPPVGIPAPVPEGREQFLYSVKFVCGVQIECGCQCVSVRPGAYATEINLHNYHDAEVQVTKHVLPVIFAGAASGREPQHVTRKASDRTVLPPHTATMDDCCRISELLLGASAQSTLPLTTGILEINSSHPLNVSAVYTVTDAKSGSVSIDVQQIPERRIR